MIVAPACTNNLTRADRSFPTYAHLEPDLPRERVARAFVAELQALAENPGVQVTSCAAGGTAAAAVWRRADWESGHLGYPCARLDQLLAPAPGSPDLRASLLKRLRAAWRSQGYRYGFSRIDTADHATLHALEEAGFITVDNISLLTRRVERQSDFPPPLPVTPATPGDLADLTRIARESFREDRFHNDPLIPNETADAMHGDWVHNQVMHGLADAVLVARQVDGRPAGFVSMGIDHTAREHLGTRVGTIVLLAVDGSARGQGLGKTLTRAALDWFHRHQVTFAQVGTQGWNLPAIRTYLAAGFKPARAYTTLRLHLA